MTAHTRKRIVWSVSIALGSVLVLGFVGPLIPCKRVKNWVCPVSGSTKRQITWFGYFSHDERNVSALEQWLKRREPSFEPQWQPLSTQTYYVSGQACGTGGTPEIYQLRPILDRVVVKLSDEKIAGLFDKWCGITGLD